jgi:hypothetical protein
MRNYEAGRSLSEAACWCESSQAPIMTTMLSDKQEEVTGGIRSKQQIFFNLSLNIFADLSGRVFGRSYAAPTCFRSSLLMTMASYHFR